MKLLLTVSEDRTTRRRDPSAGTGVSGKGDADGITLFFTNTRTHLIITLSGNPKAINLGGEGAGPRMRQQALQLFDMYGIAGSQTPPDSVQLSAAAFFIAQELAPFGRRVLARKHRGRFQVRPGLDQMVQDLDPILRVPTDRKIVY